jgi:hypothetical protein
MTVGGFMPFTTPIFPPRRGFQELMEESPIPMAGFKETGRRGEAKGEITPSLLASLRLYVSL